jgi:hypothetical protein
MIATDDRYFMIAGGMIVSTRVGDYWAVEFGDDE